MLVLSRKEGEEVVIGDEAIVVCVQRIGEKHVSLSFEIKDAATTVHRREVFEQIRREAA